MRKILLSVAIALGSFATSYAQAPYPCHTDEKTQEFVESLTPMERAQYKADQEAYETEIQNYIDNHPELLESSNPNQRTIKYTIPVVFHIIHDGGPENISDEQVKNCVQHMNDDYQMLNSGATQVVSEFQDRVADAEIEFKLAKLDGNGNCTNGITRTRSTITDGGSGEDRVSVVKSEHGTWPGDKYINVFIAKDIGGAAGYTQYPSPWMGASMNNGIHVLHNYVGSIGTSGAQGAHTLTHEIGHWLNLPHLWGNSNNPGVASNCDEDDGVADTPNTIGWTTCNLSGESCGSLDNVENYMEYSYCSKMFTEGQKARMHAALESPTGGRNNIHTASNLTATGVNLADVMCEANFQSNIQEICPGETVTFEDLSYSGVVGWEWNFPGGSPTSSTDESPTVTYNTPGTYKVELTATDGSASKSVTKNAFITVLENSVPLPVVEGFEDLTSLSGSFWSVENKDNNAEFNITSTAAHTGSKSIKLKNFGQPSGKKDAIISSPVDLSGITDEVTLSFRYAYRKRSNSNNEWLRVFITKNCGKQWIQRKTITGSSLGTEKESSSWTPESQEDWVTVHMTNITSSYWVDNFRFKFEFESDGGNNFYMDDINIYSGPSSEEPLSVNDESLIKSFGVYPNPADQSTNVTFSLEKSQNVNVSLVNMMGQTIQSNDIQAETGNNLVMIDTKNIQSGVYLIQVNAGNAQQVKRLIIN